MIITKIWTIITQHQHYLSNNLQKQNLKMRLQKLRNFFSFSISAKDHIIFFGSGKVALPSVKKLIQNYSNLEIITHYTNPKVKLTNQVQILCQQKNISYYTPITSKDDKLKRRQEWTQFAPKIGQPQFGIVCSYGYMIPKIIIQKFKRGLIVIHPSLLPKYRGGSPIFHAIANGQTQTGVSYIQIVPGKYDQGNLLYQKSCPLQRNVDYPMVEQYLANFAAQNMIHVLQNLNILRPGTPQSQLTVKQQDKNKLKAPLFYQKKLDMNQKAQRIYNLARALVNPRVVCGQKQLILTFQDQFKQDVQNLQFGKLKVFGKRLFVKCQDKLIRVKTYKQPSKLQLHIGKFIASQLRGKPEQLWPKFQ